MLHRRSSATAAVLVLLLGGALSACGFDLATDRVNTIAAGTNNRDANIDALGIRLLAEKAGVDRETAYQVLAESAVGAPFVQYKRAAFLAPDETPTAFSLTLAQKDLSLILSLAERAGARLPQAEVNLDSLQAAAAALGGERDFSSVASYLRSNDSQQQ
jgi:hypothetical protein